MKFLPALLAAAEAGRTEYSVQYTCTNGLCNCIDEVNDPLGKNYIGNVQTTKNNPKRGIRLGLDYQECFIESIKSS